MLRGEESSTPRSTSAPATSSRVALASSRRRSSTTRRPDRDLRLHRHRRVPPLDLQPLAAGARILRRLLIGLTATPASRPSASSTRTSSWNTATSRPWPTASTSASTSTSIDTEITEQGGRRVEAGFYVDKRDRQTRKVRWEQLDEDLAYDANAARPRRGRARPDPHRHPHLPRPALHRDLPRPHRRAEDADLRQGRHPRRGHRPDRARGVRQGQRLLPEDHLPAPPARSRRSCSTTFRNSLQPAHRRHRGHDRHRHRHQAAGDRDLHARR